MLFRSGLLDQGVSRFQVAMGIQGSLEYRTMRVKELYDHVLGRSAGAPGLTSAVEFLAKGGTVKELETALLSLPEYYQRRGEGSNGGFLGVVYQDAFGRPIDPAGPRLWSQMLLDTPRSTVAKLLLDSEEADVVLAAGCESGWVIFWDVAIGMDHLKLTYRYKGRAFRLTNVGGKVVKKLLA